MKNWIVVGFFFTLALNGFSQSKKELIAEKDSLQKQVSELNSQIEQLKKEAEVDLSSEKAKVSYAIGLSVGNSLNGQGIDSVDAKALAKAIEDLTAGQPAMSMQEAQAVIQQHMMAAQQEKAKAAIAEGEAFLKENATKEGVVTTASGLQYKVITEGNGPIPKATDKITAHYHGTLIDGTVFDSSVQRGQPASFPVGGVIQAWQEALQMMPVGSKWMLYVPYQLGYGERGAGGAIGPYATLIFEVELISIDTEEAPEKAPSK